MSKGETGPKAIERALGEFLRERAWVGILRGNLEKAREAGKVPATALEEIRDAERDEAEALEVLHGVVAASVERRLRCGRKPKAAPAEAEAPEEAVEEGSSTCPHGGDLGACAACDADRAFDTAREDRSR